MSELAKEWTAQVFIEEHDDTTTRARVVVHTGDTEVVGVGTAHRNRRDLDVPEIGDELAAARAFADVAHQLLEATAGDIEAVTHHKVGELSS